MRKYPDENKNLVLGSGDYGKDTDGIWYCYPPDCKAGMSSLKKHNITEHEDGTITVSPSILIQAGDGEVYYHGFLEKGVWRE